MTNEKFFSKFGRYIFEVLIELNKKVFHKIHVILSETKIKTEL